MRFDASKLCQRPKSGEVHFYYIAIPRIVDGFYLCQCPKSGEIHFYLPWHEKMFRVVGCQCPKSGGVHFYHGLFL